MNRFVSTAPTASLEQVADSRRYCRRLTRSSARNFYYGLKLLPEPKRSAMFAIYAYMRLVDDIADAEEAGSADERAAHLDDWRRRTHEAIRTGGTDTDDATGEEQLLWPAFGEVVRRYALPAGLFDEMIAGQQQDLTPSAFTTFDALHQYCYRVAGVVGLVSLRIWGYEGGTATETLAVERGVAFQLTNILRDLKEDAGRGRLYLPREELAAYGLEPRDIADGRPSDGFDRFMRFQIERAESYYERSRTLESWIEKDSRPTVLAMTEIYHGLLKKISADPRRVLRERISLSLLHKLRIGWRATHGSGAQTDGRAMVREAGREVDGL